MAYAGLQAILNLYTLEEASMTQELCNISMDITRASSEISHTSTRFSQEKSKLREQAADDPDYADSPEYEADMRDLRDEYDCTIARLNEWESHLEMEKETRETQLQAAKSYKEGLILPLLKENVKKDHTYFQGGSS